MDYTGIPRLTASFCDSKTFEDAFRVLDECTVSKPTLGFDLPFCAPGGAYGDCWWSLDSALAVYGYIWAEPEMGANLIKNLAASQCKDGRVKLYGIDRFGHVPSIKEEVGSLPKFFDVCYSASLALNDSGLIAMTYELFSKNLEWWFARRQDKETGLITAVFEETFIANDVSGSMVYAPVDTNIAVAHGCRNAANLVQKLGISGASEYFLNKENEILDAVYNYLWDEEKGAYYPYVLPKKQRYYALMASTFLGLEVKDPTGIRHKRLISLLTDDDKFNWNLYPLTSVSKDDPLFTTVTGVYNGNPCWSGSVWSLINDAAIQALNAAGLKNLSAELSYKTVLTFAGNYCEFVHPFTRSGEGVQRYAWTASHFIRIVIEELFGVKYDGAAGKISLEPNLPDSLRNDVLILENLHLPNGRRVDILINAGVPSITGRSV